VGVLVALMLVLGLREPVRDPGIEPRKEIGMRETFRHLMKIPGVLRLMVAFACANGVGAIFLVWAPTFLFEKFHLGLVTAGFSAVAAIQLASAASAPLSGLLADRLSRDFRGAHMLIQAVALVIGSFCVMAVGHAQTMSLLIGAMLCFGFCKGAYDGGIFASVFDLVPPGERASAAGLMNMLGWGGGALGPLAIGLVSSYGHGTPMERMSAGISWSGVAYLMAAGLILSALRFKYRKR
jgi:MFS family permease